MSKKYDLGESLENKLYDLEVKLNKETSLSVFSKQEQLVMFSAFEKINGTIPPKNCSGCFLGLKKSLINWLKMYPKPLDMTNKVEEVEEILTEEKEKEDTKAILKEVVKKPRDKKETKKK